MTPRERTVANIRTLRRYKLARPRRRLPRQIFPRTIEIQYAKEITARFLDPAMAAVRRDIVPMLPALVAEEQANARTDAPGDRVNSSMDRITDYFWKNTFRPAEAQALAEQFANRTAAHQRRELDKQVRAALGTDPMRHEPGLVPAVQAFTAENVALIKSIPNQFFDDIERLVIASVREGKRHEQIARTIEKRYGVAKKRAQLIASDQVGKLYGDLNRVRQGALGVKAYLWRTGRDNRVRPEHRVREGKRFEWSKPPWDGHPGKPIRCRCYAEPVFEDMLQDIFAPEKPGEFDRFKTPPRTRTPKARETATQAPETATQAPTTADYQRPGGPGLPDTSGKDRSHPYQIWADLTRTYGPGPNGGFQFIGRSQSLVGAEKRASAERSQGLAVEIRTAPGFVPKDPVEAAILAERGRVKREKTAEEKAAEKTRREVAAQAAREKEILEMRERLRAEREAKEAASITAARAAQVAKATAAAQVLRDAQALADAKVAEQHAELAAAQKEISESDSWNKLTFNKKKAAANQARMQALTDRVVSARSKIWELDYAANEAKNKVTEAEKHAAAVHAAASAPVPTKAELVAKLTKAGGTATPEDVAIVAREVAKMPAAVLDTLDRAGEKIVVGRGNVVDIMPHLANDTPRGWTPGSTWSHVTGLHDPLGKRVVVAVQDGKLNNHGSAHVVVHESFHGVDSAVERITGTRGHADPEFVKARNADLAKLSSYEKQVGDAGLEESYAESAARYYAQPDVSSRDFPNLHAYWEKTFGR